jgi:hypothetical protein
VPSTTLLEMLLEEQAQRRAILRRTRYGYLLAFHILLLCAVGRTPTEIEAFLFCSRSRVYRSVRASRTGSLGVRIAPDGQLSGAVQTSVLMPWLTRSLRAVLKAAPRPIAGAAPGGVVPRSQRRSRPNMASRCQRKRCATGSTRWAGCGNALYWSPKMTIRTGLSVWRVFGFLTSICKPMR